MRANFKITMEYIKQSQEEVKDLGKEIQTLDQVSSLLKTC